MLCCFTACLPVTRFIISAGAIHREVSEKECLDRHPEFAEEAHRISKWRHIHDDELCQIGMVWVTGKAPVKAYNSKLMLSWSERIEKQEQSAVSESSRGEIAVTYSVVTIQWSHETGVVVRVGLGIIEAKAWRSAFPEFKEVILISRMSKFAKMRFLFMVFRYNGGHLECASRTAQQHIPVLHTNEHVACQAP
jgi:hypothetical protein